MTAVGSLERVAFVGVGVMGKPMVRQLAVNGVAVCAFDIRPEAVTDLAAEGVAVATSLREATNERCVVITMLPDTPLVRSVLVENGGMIEWLPKGSLVIDMSTIAPSAEREMGELFRSRDIQFLDAPVSGGVVSAQTGTLSIMVGGDAAAFNRAEPILRCMGKRILNVGPLGMGQVFKMCNQLMVAGHIQAMCEAFALCRAQGGDVSRLRDVLSAGAAGSWMLDNLGPQVIARDASAGFRIDLQLKDLRLAGEAAFERSVPRPGLALTTTLYMEAKAHGEGSNGNQALFRTFDRLTNQV